MKLVIHHPFSHKYFLLYTVNMPFLVVAYIYYIFPYPDIATSLVRTKKAKVQESELWYCAHHHTVQKPHISINLTE